MICWWNAHVQRAFFVDAFVLILPNRYYFHPFLWLRAGLNVMLRTFVRGWPSMLLTNVMLWWWLYDFKRLQHVGSEGFVKRLVHQTGLLRQIDVLSLRSHQGVITCDSRPIFLLTLQDFIISRKLAIDLFCMQVWDELDRLNSAVVTQIKSLFAVTFLILKLNTLV